MPRAPTIVDAAIAGRLFVPASPAGSSPRPGSSAPVDVAAMLTRLCADAEAALPGPAGTTLICAAVRCELPWGLATPLAVIARQLITDACTAFERGRDGRIAVSFRVDAVSLELAVEHSRPAQSTPTSRTSVGSWLVRTVVARLGGRLDTPETIGGVRMIVTVPRP